MKKMILILIGVSIMCFAGKLNINYNDGTSSTEIDFSEIVKMQIAPKGFVMVEGGTFQMGDHFAEGWSSELPVHSVTLSSFYMGKYEVTQSEWQSVMTGNTNGISATPSHPDYGIGDNHPVSDVSWYAILVFCNRRSMAEGLTPVYTINDSTDPAYWGAVPTFLNPSWDAVICNWSANGYRLPSEAEWEYAARAEDVRYSGCHETSDLADYAWYDANNSPSGSKPVGTKLPNQLGLYDMSGNLYEWCWDWFGSYTSDAQTNPTGPTTGSGRVARGGGWDYSAGDCRVAYRDDFPPFISPYIYGFRLSRTP